MTRSASSEQQEHVVEEALAERHGLVGRVPEGA